MAPLSGPLSAQRVTASGIPHRIEFARYRDYKAPDAAIVDNLLWLLYAGDEMTLVKLNGRTMSDNIAGPPIPEPKEPIYFGKEPDSCLPEFLRAHGNRGSIVFKPCRAAGGHDSSEFRAEDLQITGQTEWKPYSHRVEKYKWEMAGQKRIVL